MKATHLPEKTKVVVEQKETFVLELNPKEATLLLEIAYRMNGPGIDWYKALKEAGVRHAQHPLENYSYQGNQKLSISANDWMKKEYPE